MAARPCCVLQASSSLSKAKLGCLFHSAEEDGRLGVRFFSGALWLSAGKENQEVAGFLEAEPWGGAVALMQ
jgi:hypothetical protein